MRISTLLLLSWQSLTAHKRRSFLTMAGLIIGIAAVILVMAIGAGAQSLITAQIEKRGTDMIAVLPGSSDDQGPPASALGIVVTTLTHDDMKALADHANVQHIKYAAAYISGNDVLQWKDEERQVTYTGTTARYVEVERVRIKNGRFFDDIDELAHARVAVIGSRIAEQLFGNQDPVGQTVRLKKKQFKIVGLLEPKGSTLFENPDDSVLIPLSTAQRDLLGVKHVSFLRLVVDQEAYLKESVEVVHEVLRERHGEVDFSIRNTADVLTILTNVTNGVRFFLVAVAGMSLFVGGVGLMNIMLIAVKEKTREVGLRKAVGARRQDILWQFLFETVLLAVIGGVVGILLGSSVAYVVAVVVNSLGYTYAFILSPWAIGAGLVTAGVIGVVFGTVPAQRAARLDPIVALRYE